MKHFVNKRFFQKKITHLKQKGEFIFSHLSFARKIGIFSLGVILLSLFISWFQLPENNYLAVQIDARNSFSHLLGNVGYFFFFMICLDAFWLLSTKNKKKLQYFSGFYFSESALTLTISLIILGLSIHSYFLIGGLSIFLSEIQFSSGIILCLTGAILLLYSSFLLKKEEKKNLAGSYIHSQNEERKFQNSWEEKQNMKLPI